MPEGAALAQCPATQPSQFEGESATTRAPVTEGVARAERCADALCTMVRLRQRGRRWELRAVLVSSVACLLLGAWLTVSNEMQRCVVPVTPESGVAELVRLHNDVHGLVARLEVAVARLEEVRAALESKAYERVAREPGAELQSEPVAGRELRSELQTLQLVIQSLAEAYAHADAGHSHNLTEIRRNFPVTNWEACKELMRQTLAEPLAAERSYFDSDKSTALHSLVMLRPKDLLERFGAPSETKIEASRFVWLYKSPTLGAEGQSERCLKFTFEKGYVWDIEFRVP